MVYRWADGRWGREVFTAWTGAEEGELGEAEFGSIESLMSVWRAGWKGGDEREKRSSVMVK